MNNVFVSYFVYTARRATRRKLVEFLEKGQTFGPGNARDGNGGIVVDVRRSFSHHDFPLYLRDFEFPHPKTPAGNGNHFFHETVANGAFERFRFSRNSILVSLDGLCEYLEGGRLSVGFLLPFLLVGRREIQTGGFGFLRFVESVTEILD